MFTSASGIFPSEFSTNFVHTSFHSLIFYMPCQSHPSWCDGHRICRGVQTGSWSLRLYNFLQFPLTRPSLSQIFSSVTCSRTSSVYVLLLMWHTMFHSHASNRWSYISVFFFLYFYTADGGIQIVNWRAASTPWIKPDLIHSWIQYYLLMSFPSILILTHFQRTSQLCLEMMVN
jgi:hypothetical protein